jgi:phage shock protein E
MLSFLKKLFPAPVDFNAVITRGGIIIDVRTSGEFSGGHIKGSRNVPLDQISKEIPALKKLNVPIITVCRSGNRSGMAKSLLAASGMEVYNGGAWNSLVNKLNKS